MFARRIDLLHCRVCLLATAAAFASCKFCWLRHLLVVSERTYEKERTHSDDIVECAVLSGWCECMCVKVASVWEIESEWRKNEADEKQASERAHIEVKERRCMCVRCFERECDGIAMVQIQTLSTHTQPYTCRIANWLHVFETCFASRNRGWDVGRYVASVVVVTEKDWLTLADFCFPFDINGCCRWESECVSENVVWVSARLETKPIESNRNMLRT